MTVIDRGAPHPRPGVDDGAVPPEPAPECRHFAAGQVLVVMLVGLALAALLNADRMVERAESKSFDDPFRSTSVWIWSRVQDVSELVRLDVPREKLEKAIGKEHSELDELDVEELAALNAGESPGGDPSEGQTTTTIEEDLTPVLRTPTAAEPMRFWVGGDSMTQTFGTSMQRIASSTGVIDAALDYRVSTGLTRPDFFNWPAHLVDTVLPTDPEVVVIMFGANDAQGIELADGSVCNRFEQCWLDEYRRRVAATMDLLRDVEDNDRLVIWVGQPVMGPTSGVYGMEKLNAVYSEEAEGRPWIRYFDSWPFFADEAGNYADYLKSADGTELGMRQPDDVHFSTEGGDRLSWEVLERLGEYVDLSESVATPPPSAIAPPDIAERDEIPPAVAEIID